MDITVNADAVWRQDGTTLHELAESMNHLEDIMIVNGYQMQEDYQLKQGDIVHFIPKGRMPDKEELKSMLTARHTPGVQSKVEQSVVGIAGLGGLGSQIAVLLARTGVGTLRLVDFDVVEPSNLNRQHYFISHLAMAKTTALAQQIESINPYLKVETNQVRINGANARQLFEGCDVVCEALDDPEAKAELVSTLLSQAPGIKIVAASGMAGFESSNKIRSFRKMKNLYVCGDMTSEAKPGNGLMAPRVAVCAAHQANMVLRLLLGIEEP